MNVKELLQYLKDNPHEAERMDQCFNCKKLSTCTLGDEAEDAEGMCRYYEEVGNAEV